MIVTCVPSCSAHHVHERTAKLRDTARGYGGGDPAGVSAVVMGGAGTRGVGPAVYRPTNVGAHDPSAWRTVPSGSTQVLDGRGDRSETDFRSAASARRVYFQTVNLWRTFVLSVVMLWLPVQGFAAVAMPFCQHALGHSGAVQTNGAHGEHHYHKHHHDKGSGSSSHSNGSPSGLSCNDCGACHLACSPVVPSADVAVMSP